MDPEGEDVTTSSCSTTLPYPGLLKVTLLRCCHCLFLSFEKTLSFHLLAIWPCFINPAEWNTLHCNLLPFCLHIICEFAPGFRIPFLLESFPCCVCICLSHGLRNILKILLLGLSCVCVHTHLNSYTTLCTQRSEDNV